MSDELRNCPPIDQGGVLLHVGPHKTGTTAIQAAMAASRQTLLEHGVVYPGKRASHAWPARAVANADSPVGVQAADPAEWDELLKEVRAHQDQRVVVSSEYFDAADVKTARRVVEDLGKERVHVVVTLRPLVSVLPSSWQQRVRSRHRVTLSDFLHKILDDGEAADSQSILWKRHHHDRLIERWVQAVGADRVHVVILDERNRDMLRDTFEDLLELPRGVLVERQTSANRSLTVAETELVRQMNQQFKTRKWTDAQYSRFMRLGAIKHLQQGRRPTPGEVKIAMPQWAAERASRLGAQAAKNIAALKPHIVGDLKTLASVGRVGDVTEPDSLAMDAAVAFAVGAMRAGGAGTLLEKHVDIDSMREYPGVSSAPTGLLIAELKKRLRARLRKSTRRSR